jgi:hypothetical protein
MNNTARKSNRPATLTAAQAAAFSGALNRVFSDMAANAARLEAERVKREAAAEAASAARRAAEADYNRAPRGSEAEGSAALRYAAAMRAHMAALHGDFAAYAAHLAEAARTA